MRRNIPWWAPEIGSREYELLREILHSNYINEGAAAEEFENRLASLLGARYVVAVTSGTAAISLALMGLGMRPGDEVIVPDLTFIATANAVVLAGATPVLVDVDAGTLNMDPECMARAITPRTKAVVPVHVSGRAANMEAILEIAHRHSLAVVEDAAEGFLSRWSGRCLGTIGNAGCLSFSPNKTITTGQGGAVLTNDADLHSRLRELKDQGRPTRGTGGDDIHRSIGFNFKFTNMQAAVGLGQLDHLEHRLARMRSIYRGYVNGLAGLDGISLPGFSETECPQWTDAIVEGRDDLYRHLADRNIYCRRFWFPIHTQAPYRQPDEKFPSSTRIGPKALWLPSAFSLSDEEVATVCAAIAEFVRGSASRMVGRGVS
jgi:perosamine synthetase